jgi:type 1 glutamine amidotransferase
MKQIAFLLLAAFSAFSLRADKSIVLLAGSPSHGKGEHEFRAGCLLLADCLNQVPGLHATVVSNGWPANTAILQSADSIVIYADGGDGHPTIRPDRLKLLDELAAKGVGIGAAHYGVEVPTGKPGFAMLRWTGGFFETYWSVNPTWEANFTGLPSHPITRGVRPFKIRDEWYYHMRFAPDMKGVVPILSAVPPKNTVGGDDAHGGNPFARAETERGEEQHLMWAYNRPGGGRGFGFTGGHYHENWANDNFRKLVLNAIVWSAKGEIPGPGVESKITPEQLKLNLDPK